MGDPAAMPRRKHLPMCGRIDDDTALENTDALLRRRRGGTTNNQSVVRSIPALAGSHHHHQSFVHMHTHSTHRNTTTTPFRRRPYVHTIIKREPQGVPGRHAAQRPSEQCHVDTPSPASAPIDATTLYRHTLDATATGGREGEDPSTKGNEKVPTRNIPTTIHARTNGLPASNS